MNFSCLFICPRSNPVNIFRIHATEILVMFTRVCLLFNMERMPLKVYLQEHAEKFRYIKVNDEKYFSVYFNDIELFEMD